LNELALFAGGGGGILGGKLLGWRTVCAVEINAFCARRLMQRQNEGHLPPFPIWDDVCTFAGRPWSGVVDVVSGGFPCQDISAAGTGAGLGGERSGLWVEMARIIGEVRPALCFVENSPMLTSRGLGTVLGDLAALGYDAEWGVLGAVDVGAPHKRERCWIVAYTSGVDWDAWRTKSTGQQRPPRLANGCHDVGDALCIGQPRHNRGGMGRSLRTDVRMFPTPLASNTKAHHMRGADKGKAREPRSYLPTPCATDWKTGYRLDTEAGQAQREKRAKPLRDHSAPGGQLNPTWVEWLMGWPLGWTDFRPLETDKCHSALLRHG
jgi:DNA (cytosine-5)-methyltransferase 1